VDRVRRATRVTDCRRRVRWRDAPRWITLADGRRIRLPTTEQAPTFVPPGDLAQGPQAVVLAKRADGGGAAMVRDQAAEAQGALDAYNAAMAEQYPWGTGRQLDPWNDTGGGCAQVPAGPWSGLGLLALVGLRRRRG